MKKTNLLKVILAVALLLSCVCFTGCDLVKGAIGGIINSGGLDFGGGSSDCQHENYVGRQQAPTCTEDGADMRLCVNCGKVLEKTTIPALGHDYVDGVCTRCGAKENVSGDTYTREDNYIYFGSYPQTKVTDSATLNALSSYKGTLPTSDNDQDWIDYEYYMEGSNTTAFMWYKDVTYSGNKFRAVYFTSYRSWNCSDTSGTYQEDNGYNTDTVYWFKYEPIKWRILTESNGSAFLMSEIAIDGQHYYHTDDRITRTINSKTVYENNYAESDIRAWLNETFYTTAFNSAQQSLIKTTLVDNSAASTNPNNIQWFNGVNNYACEDTNDKIFLLSQKEVTNSAYGFSSGTGQSAARQLKSSDYAKSQGCYSKTSSSYIGECLWVLRSPDCSRSYYAHGVDIDGLACVSIVVNGTGHGIVPALWINL